MEMTDGYSGGARVGDEDDELFVGSIGSGIARDVIVSKEGERSS
jgi:hypothetical protein